MNPGFADESIAFEDRFKVAWIAGPYASLPVKYPGVGGDVPSEQNGEYVRLSLLGGVSGELNIGSIVDVETAGAFIQTTVFTTIGLGEHKARQIADWIATNIWTRGAVFSNGDSGNIKLGPSVLRASRPANSKFWQLDMDTPYRRVVTG